MKDNTRNVLVSLERSTNRRSEVCWMRWRGEVCVAVRTSNLHRSGEWTPGSGILLAVDELAAIGTALLEASKTDPASIEVVECAVKRRLDCTQEVLDALRSVGPLHVSGLKKQIKRKQPADRAVEALLKAGRIRRDAHGKLHIVEGV